MPIESGRRRSPRRGGKNSSNRRRSPILSVSHPKLRFTAAREAQSAALCPRLGRNEPCHCGSGKKYKHCCYDKDQERLRNSSRNCGMTRLELNADQERHLTLQQLEKKSAAELVRMDPSAIPRHLLTDYFVRMALVDLDQAARNLEKLGYQDDLEDPWFFIMFTAVRFLRKDIGDRMFEMRRPLGLKEEDLRLSQRLLLARDEPAKWLKLIQEASVRSTSG